MTKKMRIIGAALLLGLDQLHGFTAAVIHELFGHFKTADAAETQDFVVLFLDSGFELSDFVVALLDFSLKLLDLGQCLTQSCFGFIQVADNCLSLTQQFAEVSVVA